MGRHAARDIFRYDPHSERMPAVKNQWCIWTARAFGQAVEELNSLKNPSEQRGNEPETLLAAARGEILWGRLRSLLRVLRVLI